LQDGEGDGVLCEGEVLGKGGESRLVVVLEEGSEESGVGACILHLIDAVDQVAHAATGGLEGLGNPVIAAIGKNYVVHSIDCIYLRGVVERTAHVLLERADNIWVTVVDLSDDIHAS
jgi:hypothetical protein